MKSGQAAASIDSYICQTSGLRQITRCKAPQQRRASRHSRTRQKRYSRLRPYFASTRYREPLTRGKVSRRQRCPDEVSRWSPVIDHLFWFCVPAAPTQYRNLPSCRTSRVLYYTGPRHEPAEPTTERPKPAPLAEKIQPFSAPQAITFLSARHTSAAPDRQSPQPTTAKASPQGGFPRAQYSSASITVRTRVVRAGSLGSSEPCSSRAS